MILTSRGRISRSCGRVRMLAWAPSKEVWVNDDREPSCDSRVRSRDNTLIQYWLLRCLALPILAALWWVPAAAQCTAYVPTHKSNSVAVIDTMLDRVVAVVPVQIQPLAVAITPNEAFAYVTNSGWIFGSDSVSVIDTASNAVVATILVGSFPVGIAITPNGAFAYVANLNSNSVSVINTATNTVSATIGVGSGGPYGLAITPNGAFAYVTNLNSNDVSVIDTATNTVVATVPVGSGPVAVAVTPDGAFAYVVNEFANTLSGIDTTTNAVVDTIQGVGLYPVGIAIAPHWDALSCR